MFATCRTHYADALQIAESGALEQRHVREWLGAMTVGRIIEYAPDDATYALPPERGACLTRAAGPDNLALMAASCPSLDRSRGR